MEKKYRIIFHIDLNAFFASCEMAQDSSLKDIPLGIGGSTDRGVLTTANYVARKFGVTSGMNVIEAKRLCPKIVLLPVNFDLYNKYSQYFFELLNEYCDVIEKGSIDEGYLDMTYAVGDRHPVEIAEEIQIRLVEEYNLPTSIGIAPNMFLAKMASNMKKPMGITILRKRDVEEKLWPCSIESMFGIGKKTYPNLKLIGIHTIGDLIKHEDNPKLKLILGNRTEEFINKARGEDNNPVEPHRHVEMKSIGNSSTYETDVYDYAEAIEKLKKLTQKVVDRLKADNSVAKTINIQIRYPDFSQISRSFTLQHHTDNFYDIFEVCERLFDDNQSDQPIRLLGVSVSNLIDSEKNFRQLNIFTSTKALSKEIGVQKLLESINKNYNTELIHKGVKKKG
jgi:DNA polymerase-4